MKTLIFQGYLRELYPDGIKVNARSANEAISLLGNFPGFRTEDGVIHHVFMPDFPTKDAFMSSTELEVLTVSPVTGVQTRGIEGSGGSGKSSAWIQIIVGAVLMYFSYGTVGYEMVFTAGLGLVLGGMLQLMMKQPSKALNENDPRSNYMPANKNTVAVGTTIPLLFGRRKVYGHIISFNVTATNLGAPALLPQAGTGEAIGEINSPIDYGGNWGA